MECLLNLALVIMAILTALATLSLGEGQMRNGEGEACVPVVITRSIVQISQNRGSNNNCAERTCFWFVLANIILAASNRNFKPM